MTCLVFDITLNMRLYFGRLLRTKDRVCTILFALVKNNYQYNTDIAIFAMHFPLQVFLYFKLKTIVLTLIKYFVKNS